MNGDEQSSSRSYERERVDSVRLDKKHLPRLAPEYYRGHAFVHWTLAIENRATGWLTPSFHRAWELTLLHTCVRYDLVCPAYVLMPDHVHVILIGLDEHGSDQRVAVEFLRKYLRTILAPFEWQHQTHDSVLRGSDRERGGFTALAHYIFENPVRARLVARWQEYSFTGCCIAGYPALNFREDGYWDLFWRIYGRLIEPHPSTRSRS